ncbi:MAG: hypothetical protein QMC89_06470 [Candidatus Hodarchaeaceae archaeon]|nr:hypothetical protein [Candidatus Hodarchaeaceae archaeon]
MVEDGIDAIFEPKSVMLIGASRATKNEVVLPSIFFRSLAHNMLRFFKGKIYVIDLSGRLGAGGKSPKLPKKLDLAVLVLPPNLALKHLRKLVGGRVKAVVVISGGYGREQLERLARVTVRRGIRVLGPNATPGVLNTSNGLCATIERGTMPKRGGVAVISQGEGLGAAMLDWACFHGISISKFASVGDKVDIDEADLIDYLSRDRGARVICIYMEETVRGGRKFFNAVREAAKRKPVVALSRNMAKVTVEQAPPWRGEILDAVLRQAGAVRARDFEEFFDAAIALAKQPPMQGNRVAVLSNAFGPAVLAAEALQREGLTLAKLSDETTKQIKKKYPDADGGNLICMTAAAKADCYEFVLKHVLDDPGVDGAMVINMLKSCLLEPDEVKVVADVAKKFSNKPVVDVPMGGEDYVLVSDVLKDTDIPTYSLPERGARALRALYLYGQIKKKVEM